MDDDQKTADHITKTSRAIVRPFVMLNADLTPEQFEIVACARLQAYLDYHEAAREGAEPDEAALAVDQLWCDGIWRAMWHEYNRIRMAGGGGRSSLN